MKKIISEIQGVTIFLSGASIRRNATVAVTQTSMQLLLSPLSNQIVPESLVVSAQNAVVTDVRYDAVSVLNDCDRPEKMADLIEAYSRLEDSLAQTENEIKICEQQLQFFAANCNAGGEKRTLETIKELAGYYLEQNRELHTQLLGLKKQRTEQKKQLEQLKQGLEHHGYNEPAAGALFITINGEIGATAFLKIEYFDCNAGFEPYYDLSASDALKNVQLQLKARVLQSTGENWHEVSVVLSSGAPQAGLGCPRLTPWYLCREPEVRIAALGDYKEAKLMECEESFQEIMPQTNLLAMEFALPGRFSIEYGKPALLNLQTHDLPVEYVHFCVPKLEKSVYLLARIGEWDKLDLLDGACNLFYNGSYVGKTRLDRAAVLDSMDIPLGKADEILVTRTQKRDGASKSLFGNQNKVTRHYELLVRNMKNCEIHLKLIDQLPVSADDTIKVNALETSGAMLAENGELSWDICLKAGQSVARQLVYSVVYPKTVPLLLE